MSKNIQQIFATNPITTNVGTDLMYFGRSPYGATNDVAMTYTNFSAQFASNVLTTKGDLLTYSTVPARLAVGTVNGQILQVNSAATTGLAWSTATYPVTTTINQILYSSSNNVVGGITAAVGGVLISNNSSVPSFLANPSATGKFLQSVSGAAPIWSTASFPTSVGATGTILRSDGTSWVASTATFADTYAASTILYSNGISTVTGLATANNGLLVTSSAGVPSILAGPGTTGNILQSNAAAAPSFSTATYPSVATGTGTILRANGTNWVASTSTFADTYAVSTLLYASGSNAVSGLATVNSAVLVTGSTGIPVWSSTMTNGQMIIGSTGATPTVGTITTSGNISITTGAGTVALAGTGMASFTWNDVAGTSQAASAYSGYIISNAGQTTVTLPATAAEGTVFAVAGKGAAGWILKANTGQIINYGSSPTSSAGTLTSTNQWDSVQIVCVTANTTFTVIASQGILTVA